MTAQASQLAAAAAVPQTPRREAAAVATAQYAALLALLRDLDAADWARPTDCPGWTVREVAAHVVGAADEGAHLRVLLRHLRSARAAGAASMVDGLNAAQIADRQGASPSDLVGELARLAPKAVRARRRAPALVRRRPVPGNELPAGADFGYLFDVIFSRDVWMHRVDVARACQRELPVDGSDGQVVEQVVRDLGRFWSGPPVAFQLTGPGGGCWLLGAGEPVAQVQTETVPYLRLLSGRVSRPELAITGDPAVYEPLLAARVVF